MGLSEGQKKRKYGEQAGAAPRPAPARPRPVPEPPRPVPQEKKSTAGMIVGVLTSIAVLLFLYLHLLVLPRFGATAGITAPELRLTGFDQHTLEQTARALGPDGLRQYRYIHHSTALLAPLLLGLSWVLMIAVSVRERAKRWVLWAVPILYATLFLAGNAVLEQALADPAGGSAATASALVICRWVLLAAMVALAAYLAVQLVRGKVDAFSRGELPEQIAAREAQRRGR